MNYTQFLSENIWTAFIIASVLVFFYLIFEIKNKKKSAKELLFFVASLYVCSTVISLVL